MRHAQSNGGPVMGGMRRSGLRRARRSRAVIGSVVVSALLALTVVLVASPASPVEAAPGFPEIIALPDGFRPEGIAVGAGHSFYAGSIPTGAIYKGDLRTGTGAELVPATAGRAAIGLAVDQRERVFVAGGATGRAFVYDGHTGATLATYVLSDPGDGPTFVNDVVVTKDAAWFTDSFRPVLYRVPIARSGALGAQADVATVALTGDYVQVPGFNLNGIDATANGKTLVVVQSGTGKLFTVDPATGASAQIALAGGESVPAGDGILLDGRTLYVVQNQLNLVARGDLAPDLSTGTVVSRTGAPSFDVPTTVARFGNRLYLVNARFTAPPVPTTEYWITQIARP